MYVGRRGPTYYLARMPGSGMLHDSRCGSAENVNLFSGIVGYAHGAVIESPDGNLNIAFDQATSRSVGATAIGIDGLLDLIIDTANLNAWSPAAPERSWQQARKGLSTAAAAIDIRDAESLGQLLLLPVPFEKDTYDAARSDQEDFLSVPGALRLICAPLREVRPTQYGWQLVLKHMPRTKFWISQKVAAVVEGAAGGTLTLSDANYPALCLAIVRRAKGDGFTVVQLALRRTDRRFVPCLSLAENAVADLLVERGIPHLRPLRFDLPWDAPLCDLALTEGFDPPAPIFVLDASGSSALDDAKRSAFRVLAGGPVKTYCVQQGNWTPELQ